jgi:UrcA family protein
MPFVDNQTSKTRRSRSHTGSVAVAAGLICAALVSGSGEAKADPVRRVFSWNPLEIVRQTRVDYSDLDLNTTQGARMLLERIDRASEAVCGGAQRDPSPTERREFDDCRVAAVSHAVRTVKNPLLTALASDRGRTLFAAQ